jgi:N,N-dimethylformamidase
VPTYTYLAYGNVRAFARTESNAAAVPEFDRAAVEAFFGPARAYYGPGTDDYIRRINVHEEIGASTYDHHEDGSPIHFSSWLRPLLTMRPKTIWWTFCADLLITDWLEATGFDYDVITDDVLHAGGVEVLRDYRVIMTGNHPEYVTTEQLDALHAYLEGGGRLMYMGGNGFYWRTAVHDALPGVVEIRRGRGSTQTWKSDVGEDHFAFTGELGGLWRDVGRPPQQLVGVGFVAQGSAASYYRVAPNARSSRAGFALDGIDEVIGNFGHIGGNAAGQEIDQTNADLGTPAHTVVLARSERHGPQMVCAMEEMEGNVPIPDFYPSKAAAEVVFFETPNGGAVFAVGSMAWCGSLAHNDYDNSVSAITKNALTRMLDPTPFELPESQ